MTNFKHDVSVIQEWKVLGESSASWKIDSRLSFETSIFRIHSSSSLILFFYWLVDLHKYKQRMNRGWCFSFSDIKEIPKSVLKYSLQKIKECGQNLSSFILPPSLPTASLIIFVFKDAWKVVIKWTADNHNFKYKLPLKSEISQVTSINRQLIIDIRSISTDVISNYIYTSNIIIQALSVFQIPFFSVNHCRAVIKQTFSSRASFYRIIMLR